MLRLILIVVLGLLVGVGALAVVLDHFFGVKGLIAFPFVLIAFLWVAKFLIKNLVKKFVLSLFGMKARALRGATMNVHSIRAIPEPPEPDYEDNPPSPRDGAASEKDPGRTGDNDEGHNAESSGQAVVMQIEKKDRKDYVELDVTITPRVDACNRVWEPTEFILASEKLRSLADLEEKSIGDVHSVAIWDGSAFDPDGSGKYPGEQRLKIVFEVKPGSKSAWLCYYHEAIGQLELPVGTIEV